MKLSTIKAREQAIRLSTLNPFTVYLVIDAAGKRSECVRAYVYFNRKNKTDREIIGIYFGGAEHSAVYQYRLYEDSKLIYSSFSDDIGHLVLWADLQGIPTNGHIEIYDYITKECRYYRDKD